MLVLCISVALCADMAYAGKNEEVDDAYADALVSDRPSFTATTRTVGKLRLQIETSFGLVQDSSGGITTRDYLFPTLVRFGIIDVLEFRVQSPIYIFETTTGTRYQSGFGDVALGFKWHALDQADGGIPAVGIITSVWLPVGEDAFSRNGYVPEFLLLADWDLPYNFRFGTNLGVDVPPRDDVGDKYARFLYSAMLFYTAHGTNGRLGVFIEAAGASPLKSNKPDLRVLATGITFLITPVVQVDGFVRVGITPSTPDMEGGVGWAFRFF